MPGGGRGGMQQPPRNSNTKRNVIIAIIAIILIAGIGFFVANGAGLFGGGSVTVPNLQGQTEQEARKSLNAVGLKVGKIKLDISETVEKGKVISQTPTANSHVEPGSTVDLVISSGKTSGNLVTVPNLTGLTASEAEQQLAALGLVGESKQDSSDTVEAGKVCAQDRSLTRRSRLAPRSPIPSRLARRRKTSLCRAFWVSARLMPCRPSKAAG